MFAKIKKVMIDADLLIVGGGIAGCMAAIGAKEQENINVVVVEKAEISRSGDAGAGNDHLLAHLNTGEAWDTDEAMRNYYTKLSQGLIDIGIAHRLHLSRVKDIVEKLESYGIEMRDSKTGRYIRTLSFGQPGPYYINFKGKNIKPVLANEVKKRGVKVINRVNVTNLITRGKKVIGATGFNVRNGDFYVFNSKTTLVSAGDAVRLWPNSSGLAFNTWMSPFNNGAAHAMAFRAGAELANMELTVNTLVPKGFSAAGLNAFMGMGAYLLNSSGERYMQRYHPMGEGAPRYLLTLATDREIKDGRGPCYLDCRHLSSEAMYHLTTHLLPVDKDTFMIFCRQKGVDLEKDLLEIDVSETQIAGITGSVSGIVIDGEGRTTVDRLYAAGACTVPSYALSGAMATGYAAGTAAAQASAKISRMVPPDQAEVSEEIQSVFAPLKRKEGAPYQRVENKLRQVMADYVGDIKTEKGLRTAMDKLRGLEKRMGEVKAENYHALMRVSELKDLLLVGKLVAAAALERRESRMGSAHVRGDFPHVDDEHFHGSIVLKKGRSGAVQVRFQPAATGEI